MSEEMFEQEQHIETTKPYSVFYTDGTYIIFDLTKEDFEAVKIGIQMNKRCVDLSVGLLRLNEIRSVIIQRPVVENKAIDPLLTDEEIVWMEQWKRAEALTREVGNEDGY